MKKFCVKYHSPALAALADRKDQQTRPLPFWRFDFPDASLALCDAVRQVESVTLHTGLHVVVEIHASSEDEALPLAKNACETLLTLVTFCTLAYCGPGGLVSVIMFDGSASSAPFKTLLYPFEEGELLGGLVRMEQPELKVILNAFGGTAHKQRTVRALSWLRKGINEQDAVDEFISYWTGLEVIRGPLRDGLRLHVRNPGEWDAVQDIFENELKFSEFQKVMTARNELLHGFRETSQEFIQEIQSHIAPSRKTLTVGIARLLGLESSVADAVASREPRRIRSAPWQLLRGEVQHLPDDFERLFLNYPSIVVESTEKKYAIDAAGNLALTGNTKYRFCGPPETTWKLEQLELWGDKEAGFKGMRVDSAV